MPKKHLTSKELGHHMHACASAQSDQGLWVFTVEKDCMKYLTGARIHMTNKAPDQHVHVYPQFEQDLCKKKKKKKQTKKKKKKTKQKKKKKKTTKNKKKNKKKKKKKKKNKQKKKKKKTRKAVLSGTRSLFHWTCM